MTVGNVCEKLNTEEEVQSTELFNICLHCYMFRCNVSPSVITLQKLKYCICTNTYTFVLCIVSSVGSHWFINIY